MISSVLGLTGGLGLFLYGMFLMSDSLEKAAGSKLRNILEYLTKNRLMGVLVGTGFTAVIQSSSATTVMVVSFVNAKLMTLAQAAGVIMGANIGTTITSQLVSFNLTEVAPVFVIVGVIMALFFNNQNLKKIGLVLLGFGILFMGINIMGDSMKAVQNSPKLISVFSSLTNPFLAMLIGLAVTAIVQSSSVTVSIVLLMAGGGLLQLPICLFIILGCNIGTCVTALLASLSGKKDAKRAAMIHLLFNIFGSLITFTVLTFGIDYVIRFLQIISGDNIERQVANAHTLFKVFEVAVQFPFVNYIVKLTYLLVPGEDPTGEENFVLQYIGTKSMLQPSTASVNIIHEIERMGHMAIDNLKLGMKALLEGNRELTEKVYATERYVNFLDKEITDTLVQVNQLELPIQDAKNLGGLFHVVNDLERVGDHAENLADAAVMRLDDNVVFSKKGVKELQEMFDKTVLILNYSLDMFTHKNQAHLQEVLDLENAIDDMEETLQRSHIKRLTKGKCTPEAGIIFSDVISGLERVSDHATNIAFAILKPEEEKYSIERDEEEDEEDKNLPIVNETYAEAIRMKEELEDKQKHSAKKPEIPKKQDTLKKQDAGKKQDAVKKPDAGKKQDASKKTDAVKKKK